MFNYEVVLWDQFVGGMMNFDFGDANIQYDIILYTLLMFVTYL